VFYFVFKIENNFYRYLGSFSCDNSGFNSSQLATRGGKVSAQFQGCAVLGISSREKNFETFLGPNKSAHSISFISHRYYKLSGKNIGLFNLF